MTSSSFRRRTVAASIATAAMLALDACPATDPDGSPTTSGPSVGLDRFAAQELGIGTIVDEGILIEAEITGVIDAAVHGTSAAVPG